MYADRRRLSLSTPMSPADPWSADMEAADSEFMRANGMESAWDPNRGMTVEVWIQTTDNTARIWEWDDDTSGSSDIFVTINSNGVARFFLTDSDGNSVGIGSGRVDDGAWHHVVTTYDGSDTIRHYLDGSQTDSASLSANSVDPSKIALDRAAVWAQADQDATLLTARMWAVRTWDRELSASEVSRLHNGGSGLTSGLPSGLRNEYRFDPRADKTSIVYDRGWARDHGAPQNMDANDFVFDAP